MSLALSKISCNISFSIIIPREFLAATTLSFVSSIARGAIAIDAAILTCSSKDSLTSFNTIVVLKCSISSIWFVVILSMDSIN